jgi:hypothetical protein
MASLAFVISVVVLYLAVCAIDDYRKKRARQKEEMRFYEVDNNEFTDLGESALRNQKMKSFIMQTDMREIEIRRDENVSGRF